AECLVIHLNTPGGLLKSTRNIVGDIMESSVPVIVYVSPAGADAGSAGVFITLSANIAAMAPGTNIGAAHPVTGQGEMDGIMYGLYSPGAILPGIIGVISLILAFYSLQTLPVNYAGMALIGFALLLFILELKIASHGILAIGGIISLILGSMMLIRTGSGEVGRISWTVIVSATVVTALFFLFVIGMGIKAQRLQTTTGLNALVHETGMANELL